MRLSKLLAFLIDRNANSAANVNEKLSPVSQLLGGGALTPNKIIAMGAHAPVLPLKFTPMFLSESEDSILGTNTLGQWRIQGGGAPPLLMTIAIFA